MHMHCKSALVSEFAGESSLATFVTMQMHFVCLFDLILYVPSTIFQIYRDGSSWVEPVLS